MENLITVIVLLPFVVVMGFQVVMVVCGIRYEVIPYYKKAYKDYKFRKQYNLDKGKYW